MISFMKRLVKRSLQRSTSRSDLSFDFVLALGIYAMLKASRKPVKTQRKPFSFNELRSSASCLLTRIAENEEKEEEGEE
jgi:hypothetical protein